MIQQVLCIYDTKARAFHTPFYVRHVDIGVRGVKLGCNDPRSDLHRYAADFQLFHLGEFNDETGHMQQFQPPYNLGSLVQFKDPELPRETAADALRLAHEHAAKQDLRDKFDSESA